MNRPSSLAGIATTPATVSGPAKPWPRAGASFTKRAMSASAGRPGPTDRRLAPVPSVMPGETEPGWTAVKRMPCVAYSAASAWVMDWMPPLLAA